MAAASACSVCTHYIGINNNTFKKMQQSQILNLYTEIGYGKGSSAT